MGSGYYNGMAASIRTSGFHGFTAKANYTLGHARDDLSGTRGITPQNSYCLHCDYGNSDFDIRNSFVGFVSYFVPTPGRYKLLLGGWQLNSLLAFNGGTPFTVYSGTDTSGTGENNDRAEVIGNPFANIPANIPNSAVYIFNPAAFAAPAHGTYSNQPRNAYYGPGTYQVDFSVFKNTKITERINTQLRLEIFNVFNYRNIGGPDNGYADVGSVRYVQSNTRQRQWCTGIGTGAPRNVQLSLKVLF